jgi:hypothetical protein
MRDVPLIEVARRMDEVIREELKRRRHRRLVSRLLLVLILTAVVDRVGTALAYFFERAVKQTDIHTLFDAFFFTTVQLLRVLSQIKSPLSVAGRVVGVFLEIWAVLVAAARSVVRLTVASTPSRWFSFRSILAVHDAQIISSSASLIRANSLSASALTRRRRRPRCLVDSAEPAGLSRGRGRGRRQRG